MFGAVAKTLGCLHSVLECLCKSHLCIIPLAGDDQVGGSAWGQGCSRLGCKGLLWAWPSLGISILGINQQLKLLCLSVCVFQITEHLSVSQFGLAIPHMLNNHMRPRGAILDSTGDCWRSPIYEMFSEFGFRQSILKSELGLVCWTSTLVVYLYSNRSWRFSSLLSTEVLLASPFLPKSGKLSYNPLLPPSLQWQESEPNHLFWPVC